MTPLASLESTKRPVKEELRAAVAAAAILSVPVLLQ